MQPWVRIGSTKVKLSKVLVEEFANLGVEAKVDPSYLYPAKGYWKSQDCYRWEGEFSIRIKETGGWLWFNIGSYDTMTDCVKGLCLRQDGSHWEVTAKQSIKGKVTIK